MRRIISNKKLLSVLVVFAILFTSFTTAYPVKVYAAGGNHKISTYVNIMKNVNDTTTYLETRNGYYIKYKNWGAMSQYVGTSKSLSVSDFVKYNNGTTYNTSVHHINYNEIASLSVGAAVTVLTKNLSTGKQVIAGILASKLSSSLIKAPGNYRWYTKCASYQFKTAVNTSGYDGIVHHFQYYYKLQKEINGQWVTIATSKKLVHID